MTREPEEIVVLNDYASATGGSTAVAIASAVGLAARGHRVTYFSCVGPIAPELRDTPNLTVHCLGQPELIHNPRRLQAFWSGLCNRPAVAALRAVLAGKDPARTIVHAHTWTKALSPYALSAAADLGFPLVVTLHDYAIACPTGGFFIHASGRLCPHRPLSAACLFCRCDRRNSAHKLWRAVRTHLQNRRLRIPARVSHYVGVTDFSVRVLRPHLPAGAPITVVRAPLLCVDEGCAGVERNRNFLFIGRLVPEKGVRLLADALRATDLPVTFAGDGELRSELQRLGPRARCTGWLGAAALRRELRTARALVLPSLWYETLGLVAVEAAAAGVPVIVSSNCAATEVIRHDETGLHFAHGSAAALAAAMNRLAGDNPLAGRLGRAAYRWYWRDPWTTARHVGDLLNVYGALRGRPPAIEDSSHERAPCLRTG